MLKRFKRQPPQVVYLDEENPYYDELMESKPSEDSRKKLQSQRESVWVEQIRKTVGSATLPVIVAGANHTRNKFGLKDALKVYSVELESIV